MIKKDEKWSTKADKRGEIAASAHLCGTPICTSPGTVDVAATIVRDFPVLIGADSL